MKQFNNELFLLKGSDFCIVSSPLYLHDKVRYNPTLSLIFIAELEWVEIPNSTNTNAWIGSFIFTLFLKNQPIFLTCIFRFSQR